MQPYKTLWRTNNLFYCCCTNDNTERYNARPWWHRAVDRKLYTQCVQHYIKTGMHGITIRHAWKVTQQWFLNYHCMYKPTLVYVAE